MIIIYGMIKRLSIFFFASLMIAGCSTWMESQNQDGLYLTPYSTPVKSPTAENTIIPTMAPAEIAQPTPAPLVHTIALGETISSLALTYGIPIDLILSNNPAINPNALIVGDQVVIPSSADKAVQILDTQLISQVAITNDGCSRTADGGLWCFATVQNTSDQAIHNTSVAFTLIDDDGNALVERIAPTILRLIEKDQSIPAAVYFPKGEAQSNKAATRLYSASPLDDANNGFVRVVISDEQINQSESSATIIGKITLDGQEESGRYQIWLAAAANDESGNLIGVKREEIMVQDGAETEFYFSVYALQNKIDDVQLFAEAFIVEE